MTHTNDPIRRHANGAIDTAHYIRRAHDLRSQEAHHALGTIGRRVTRLSVALPAVVMVVCLVVLLPMGAVW